jgi:hypothetical protein
MFEWMEGALKPTVAGLIGVTLSGVVSAQQPPIQGIYICTDARGRKLTSDRPIPECADREQKLLNPSGTLNSKLAPPLSAQERQELDIKERAALEERAKAHEEKRRDRALLVRYPNLAVHEKERREAILQIGIVKHAAAIRVEELNRQRTEINKELEFYKKDPRKIPASLRRQTDEMVQILAIQMRFISDQDDEIKRINARFDEELVRLKQLWAQQTPTPAVSVKRAN